MNISLTITIDDGDFVIDGIRVHRISRYSSADHKSVLKVSEITELDVNAIVDPTTDITVFKAIPSGILRPGCEKVDLWHEVSISSVDANKVFEQNKKLELGDEAGWTTEYLSKVHALEAMLLPACEMLKRMDGVGYYNDNGVNHSRRARQLQSEGQSQDNFW